MSILKRNYEISVWQNTYVLATDENSVESETEAKIAVIGSDKMTSPNRAFEPKLTRKTNGEVKFNFKMYYRYMDNITGEEIENPFCKYLINERKIKLKYEDKWYDFLIRNVSEDSANKTFSYELEDAHMIELSKNGFGLTLDNELMNNTGTAKELGLKILENAGWGVDENSDVIVQTLDEALYECTLKEDLNAYHILDPTLNTTNDKYEGCSIEKESNSNPKLIKIPKDKTIYIFYSSYNELPYRFQFIYVEEPEKNIITDDNRIILNADCQYYIDNLTSSLSGTLSTDYRGRRYVFSQESKYFPKLERYAQSFIDGEGTEYYGFIETEIVTPQIIQNYVSNHTFKSTAGWRGAVVATNKITDDKYAKEKYIGECEAVAVRSENGSVIRMIDDFTNGNYLENNPYQSALKITTKSSNNIKGVVINNGFQDFKDKFPQGLKTGDSLVFYIESDCQNVSNLPFDLSIIDLTGYTTEKSGYYFNDELYYNELCIIKKDDWKVCNTDSSEDENQQAVKTYGFYYIWTVGEDIKYTSSQMKSNKIGFVFSSDGEDSYYLFDFQVFPYVQSDSTPGFIFPKSQAVEAKIVDHYYYFTCDENLNINGDASVDSIEDLTPVGSITREIGGTQKPYYGSYKPSYNNTAEKVRSISVKESNYFNAIQTLAETFECWPEINVEHNSDGTIDTDTDSKKIRFRKYVGSDNYAGFRYGTNLKSIKRTLDSKAIVTKLIVKDNTNEFAKNGFCSVARAPSNDLKDTCLYDFSYYINQKLLDAKVHQIALYGKDGYFNSLHNINTEIDKKIETLLPLQESLVQVKANVQLYENTVESARNNYEDTSNAFINETGFSHLILGDIIRTLEDQNNGLTDEEKEELEKQRDSLKEQIKDSDTIQKYLQELSEFKSTEKTYVEKLKKEKEVLVSLETQIAVLEKGIEDDTKAKEGFDKDFFKRYSNFIQEGTWLDDKYVDDELYYIDAQSVLYNSCFPQVSYSIDIIDLSKLPGFEMFNLGLGDRTYVEDPEFFGYNDDDSCYREEIVITEYQEDLDEPSKDSIKAQNHKTQFQDLFQRITATVQSVQYAEGSYEKAAALADADAAHKVKFLQDALNDAALILNNAGDQSVLVDINGITITDVDEPSQQIRLVGGGIFLRQQLENGEQRWTTAITAKGINASLITTGQINTSVIQIMNGTEPTFRWDALGITAYDFQISLNNAAFTYDINTKKGVRFDRLGIYGFDGQDGLSWHPTLEQVQQLATFALTWEGLKVTGTDKTVATIGKHSDSGKDYIMRVINSTGQETFSISNDGTISAEIANFKLAEIGGWQISENELYSVNDNWHVGLSSDMSSDDNPVFYAYTFSEDAKKDYRFKVSADGTLYSTKGTIGGWNIDSDELYHQVKTFDATWYARSGMWCTSAVLGNPIFYAGAKVTEESDLYGAIITTAPFYVTNTGKLKATQAEIDGVVYARAGMFSGAVNAKAFSLRGATGFQPNSIPEYSLCAGNSTATYTLTLSKGDAGYVILTASKNITETFWIRVEETSIQCKFDFNNNNTTTETVTVQNQALYDLLASPPSNTFVLLCQMNEGGTDTAPFTEIDRQALSSEVAFKPLAFSGAGVFMQSSFLPASPGKYNLGSGAYRWHTAYITKLDNSSDRRLKENFAMFNDDYNQFYDSLKPLHYNFISDTDKPVIRFGYVAQDIEDSINTYLPITNCTYDILHKKEISDGDYYYGLNYLEFISLNTWQIQLLKPRMTAAEEEIISLKSEITELRQMIENLQNSENSDII